METKMSSSSGFSHRYSTEELYVLTRHWVSDISFFEKEIQFFQFMIEKSCMPVMLIVQPVSFDSISNDLQDLQKRKELLKDNIITQQNKLSVILDEYHADEQDSFNLVQSKLEAEFFDFIKTFRNIKLKLFESCQKYKENPAQSLHN
ncbi:hypothetical protein WG906_02060 [Pedobacter sp. P351]|uniref:hypothetical protein n=1 Tax=Pedobacter superstes TaxID=3133441 RepID=UPI003097FE17